VREFEYEILYTVRVFDKNSGQVLTDIPAYTVEEATAKGENITSWANDALE
jgi:hypothetical protein